MRTIVDDLNNEVYYFVNGSKERYESLSQAEEMGEIEGVELLYYCPYCDCPNTTIHTTPVPDGLIDECENCDRPNEITPEKPDRTHQYHAEDFEQQAKRLQRRRIARLVGERDPSAIGRASVAELFAIPAIGISVAAGIIFIALSPFVGAATLVNGSIVAFIAILFSAIAVSYMIKTLNEPISYIQNWVVGNTLPGAPKDLIENADIIEHGAQIARDEEQLYVPPKSIIETNQKQTEEQTELLEKH